MERENVTGAVGVKAVRVKELRARLAATLTRLDAFVATVVALIASKSISMRVPNARFASSGDSVSSTANSRAPKPVVARSVAVGVSARRRRTSFSRLVAMPFAGLRDKAVRSATTASSKLRCSR